MDTSSNLMDYRVCDLVCYLEEDNALSQKSYQVVMALLNQLKPVAKYISHPVWLCEEVNNPLFSVICTPTRNNREPAPGTLRGIYLCRVDRKCDHLAEKESELYLNENCDFFLTHKVHGDHCRGYRGGSVWMHVEFKKIVESLKSSFDRAIERRNKQMDAFKRRSEMLDKILEVMKQG